MITFVAYIYSWVIVTSNSLAHFTPHKVVCLVYQWANLRSTRQPRDFPTYRANDKAIVMYMHMYCMFITKWIVTVIYLASFVAKISVKIFKWRSLIYQEWIYRRLEVLKPSNLAEEWVANFLKVSLSETKKRTNLFNKTVINKIGVS